MPPSKRKRYCSVPGCGLPTNSSRSKYCARHYRAYYTYGHPEGDCLLVGELRPYLKVAEQIINDNTDHPEVARVLGWIQRFLDVGEYMTKKEARTHSQDVRRWLGILQSEEIQPRQILAVILAARLYHYARPSRFKDIKHYRHTVIHRVLKLARGHEKGDIRFKTREFLSQHLLRPLFNYCTTLSRLHYRDWEDTDQTMMEKAKSYHGFNFLPTATDLPQ